MSRLATSFVLGYHGCDLGFARKAVLDGAEILQSQKDYDWLGPGAYFWESDPLRAWEWADDKVKRGTYKAPAVLGAVIDLRNCLDLVSREGIEIFIEAHRSFRATQEKAGLPMPNNRSPKGTSEPDRLLRFLDCAVFRHLHAIMEKRALSEPDSETYDTVRGMFVEGGRVFSNSGVYKKSHVQLAVRNSGCILGLFLVPRPS